jgi:hypothetical protein
VAGENITVGAVIDGAHLAFQKKRAVIEGVNQLASWIQILVPIPLP